MPTKPQTRTLPLGEFVALMALLMSLVALAIDTILPALPAIGTSLGVIDANDTQLVVSVLLLGLSVGQLLAGPLSDWRGRKPIVGLGLGIFAIGCGVSIFSTSLPIMLVGRFIQGAGLAGPRVVCIALIRDLYAGEGMARVMSFVMAVFILVPMIAPAMGQLILAVADWRAIFGAFLLLAALAGAWFAVRQPETLEPEQRRPLSPRRLAKVTLEIFRTRTTVGYATTAGLVSGAFIGYLSTAQQIFQEQYDLGTRFPLVFAFLALAIGAAAVINGRMVQGFGMRPMVRGALLAMTVLSAGYAGFAVSTSGHPPLWSFLLYMSLNLFAVGILFGNLNAIAMEPLGHIAGLGAAIVGALTTLLSVLLGIGVGKAYDGTVIPLVAAFAILGILSLATVRWTEAGE